ncbi:MAG: PxxKW family cysteine-rich protein [Deltaproteobacteria bacterium]|nr:PxxKW family cysteine-rich protein [Deltaproteobacteria bacterium]
MVCTTVKEGIECLFMSNKGCQFNGGSCHAIIDKCEGCQKVLELPTGNFCGVFPDPAIKWRMGACNMATHVKASNGSKNGKLNPLKASKRRVH